MRRTAETPTPSLLGTCQAANILQKAIGVCGPDTNADDIGISGVTSNCRIFETINESDQKAIGRWEGNWRQETRGRRKRSS